MTKAVAPLVTISRVLERWHGPPPAPFPTRPFEIILFENVAYLASDVRRRRAFDALATSIGTTPQEILAAPPEKLWRVTEHGILPDQFAAKLALAAEIALSECDGDLDAVVRKPVAEAKRTLRKFPGIGEPGAEKILLFTGRHAFLAPDSNALRVLVRLGVVTERKNYAATYKAAREVAERQLGDDVDAHLAAHQLLRRHGQEICKRSSPACERCPLNDRCRFGR